MAANKPKPDLRIRSSKYQPTKVELEEVMRIDATPEELAPAVLRPVTVRYIGEDDQGWISRLKIAVAATCAVAILAIGVSANAAFKDGHELLEAGDAYMDSTSGDAKRFTEHSVYLGLRFSTYVSAFYDGHVYASLWHGRQTCVPPEGSTVGAVYGGLLMSVHRFLSHGAVYGLEPMTVRTFLALSGHFKDAVEALSPKEFLDLPPGLLVFLGMEAFCADISPPAPES